MAEVGLFNYFFIKHLLSFCDLLGAGSIVWKTNIILAPVHKEREHSSTCGHWRHAPPAVEGIVHTHSRTAVWLPGWGIPGVAHWNYTKHVKQPISSPHIDLCVNLVLLCTCCPSVFEGWFVPGPLIQGVSGQLGANACTCNSSTWEAKAGRAP